MKNYLFIGVILTGFFVSCSSKKNKKAETVIPKTLGRVITDTIEPPVVTMLTGAKAPKVIKAAKPTSVPLSYPYGVGVPEFTNYTIADGLPNNDIFSLAQDHDGNMWFGTNGGLSKYDGTSFTNYSTVNGLASDFIFGLFIDSKNRIWITTIDKGISIFDGRSFTNHDVVDRNFFDEGFLNIRGVLEDNKGIIWLNTVAGLYKYADEKFSKVTMGDTLADKSIASIIKDKNGNLLITTGNGIKSFDGRSFSPYTSIPDIALKGSFSAASNTPIRSGFARLLYCDSKGDIWFTYQSGGLGSYDGKQIKMYQQADSLEINQIMEDGSGNFWSAGFKGLSKIAGDRFINYKSKDGLPATIIKAIAADGQGNIWAATGKGLSKVSYSYLSGLEIPEAISPNMLTIDSAGNKWIVTSSCLLGKYNAEHIDLYGKELLAGGRRKIYSSVTDHAGNIWFFLTADEKATSTSELIKFDGNTYTVYGKEQGLFFGKFGIFILKDNAGNIWSLCNNGFVKMENNSFTVYDAPKDLLKTTQSIFQDTKGQYWFGTYNAGVYKFDGHHFTVYDTHDGLPYNFISDIAEDPMGNIWFATDGGASEFDGKTFTNYRAKEGLDNTITMVKYDSVNQSLWFATNLGIASLKIDEIGKQAPFFQHYNPRTGFNVGSSYRHDLNIDNRGVLWSRAFTKGFISFNYKATREIKPLPIRIKIIKLDNKNICWSSLRKGDYPDGVKDSLAAVNEMVLKFRKAFSEDDFSAMTNAFGKVSYDSVAGAEFIPANLVLPIKNNSISFEFATISPSFGKAVQYQYKLEGYDKNWSELSTKTEASFGNMSEGDYTFHVKALSPFGSWSETSYSFRVLPPWWRTWWAYISYVLLLGIAVFTFIRWRTKSLQTEKTVLEGKVAARTAELNQSLENLKATQSQLIQSEKMASLGELTAGIAHEIQNPLNFVNNFSEVNKELIEELNAERLKPNAERNEQLEIEILNDIKENEEKINHHGKRADAIVKGMLQHSRSSSGVKEPTDINALCDEYLRLSYHGLRAKDKSFNATMNADFDETIGNINIVPQDIGRVMLNLINNAFYVVDEKKRSGVENYEPTVSVSTKKVKDKVEIKVTDNGNGIPQKILDKIFQPFFTTKPTGQGTGLGLSLSYDIVKAHGGEIKVETKENEGTIFSIELPIS